MVDVDLLASHSSQSTPFYAAENDIFPDVVFVTLDDTEHSSQNFVGEIVGLAADFDKALVCGVVIVFLGFLAGIFEVIDLDIVPQTLSNALHFFGQLIGGEGFHDLVEDAQLPFLGRGALGHMDALKGVVDVEIAAGLAAFAVDSEWVAHHGLNDEPIENGSENLVIVEKSSQLAARGSWLMADG